MGRKSEECATPSLKEECVGIRVCYPVIRKREECEEGEGVGWERG